MQDVEQTAGTGGKILEPWTLPEYPECPVYAMIPDGYHPDRPIGLLFFMHGGDRNSTPEQPFKSYLNPETGVLRPHIDRIPFITIAPAALPAVDGKRWNRKGVSQFILAVIEDVCRKFNIDRDRIILGGHSMGGFGAFHQGVLLADRFAGVWLSSGAWLEEDFRGFLGTPVYLMHGKWDCAAHYSAPHPEPRHHDWCGVSFARAAHELMLRDDVAHVYDEHEGGHSLNWEPSQMALQRFLNWAARQKRDPYAPRCAVITPNGSCDPDLEDRRASRWLEITQTVPGKIELDKINLTGPNIAWTIDELNAQSYYLGKTAYPGASLTGENLSGNRFRFEAKNVREFICRLHPAMADLSRKITAEINGKTFECIPEADDSHPDYRAKITLKADLT